MSCRAPGRADSARTNQESARATPTCVHGTCFCFLQWSALEQCWSVDKKIHTTFLHTFPWIDLTCARRRRDYPHRCIRTWLVSEAFARMMTSNMRRQQVCWRSRTSQERSTKVPVIAMRARENAREKRKVLVIARREKARARNERKNPVVSARDYLLAC